MNWTVTLVLSLATIVACGSEPVKPRVDAHGDGEITLTITLKVVDSESAKPLPELDVVYYREAEDVVLREFEAAKKAGRSVSFKLPMGTRTRTSPTGIASLECRFAAAFLWSFESGNRKDVGTDVFPSGRFILSKEGCVVLDRSARELFTARSYTPEEAGQIVVVRIETRTTKFAE